MGTCIHDLKTAVNEWVQSDTDFALMVVDHEDGDVSVYESAQMAYTQIAEKGFLVMRLRELRDPLIKGLAMAIGGKMKKEAEKDGKAN